jgi:lycopene beta-cyclase
LIEFIRFNYQMVKSFNALRYPGTTLIPLIFWLLTMLSLPMLGWILGEGYLLRGMSLGVLMQSAVVLIILYNAWGFARTAKTVLLVGGMAYFAEWIGSTAGFPFGKYHYTNLLQPQIAGVPLLIPLAWFMMLPPAWAIAEIILSKTQKLNHEVHKGAPRKTFLFSFLGFVPARPALSAGSWLIFAVLSSLAFTAWDLFLDPQMVNWSFWVWEQPGQYFGIPLSNYLGWIIVSALITLIANPKDLPVGPLALVYGLTWLLQTIGQGIFWSQPGPAIAGFIGSGVFVLLAWKKSAKPMAESLTIDD